MSAAIVLPMGGVPSDPTPEPKAPCLKKGDWVGWRIDGDFGEVTGVIPGQAVAIRWISTNRIEVYSFFSGAMERIVVLGVKEVAQE